MSDTTAVPWAETEERLRVRLETLELIAAGRGKRVVELTRETQALYRRINDMDAQLCSLRAKEK